MKEDMKEGEVYHLRKQKGEKKEHSTPKSFQPNNHYTPNPYTNPFTPLFRSISPY